MKIKAPKYFIQLFEEAEKNKNYVLNYLSKKVGYAPFWCEKNLNTCFKKLDKKEKDKILDKLEKTNITLQYAWTRFAYENWHKYENFKKRPARYDKKKKVIILNKQISLQKTIKGLKNIINQTKKLHNDKPKKKK